MVLLPELRQHVILGSGIQGALAEFFAFTFESKIKVNQTINQRLERGLRTRRFCLGR
jgi:hypothetical protein